MVINTIKFEYIKGLLNIHTLHPYIDKT